jgi:hypothetical protein
MISYSAQSRKKISCLAIFGVRAQAADFEPTKDANVDPTRIVPSIRSLFELDPPGPIGATVSFDLRDDGFTLRMFFRSGIKLAANLLDEEIPRP